MNQPCVEKPSGRLSPYIDGATTFFRELCPAGGPGLSQYLRVVRFFDDIHPAERAGVANKAEILALRQIFGPAMGLGAMQGRAWLKPHGYAGDFQIIDDIYTRRISDAPELRRWDEFIHAGAAPQAVRNRKDYFKRMLATQLAQRPASSKASASKVSVHSFR